MYFDGAVNACGNGAGAVIISPDKKQYPVSVKLQFGCTNNAAEYEACILGLEAALELNIRKIDVYCCNPFLDPYKNKKIKRKKENTPK
jgi:ribonuclease HI